MPDFTCIQCGSSFFRFPSQAAKGASYCTRSCQQAARRGRPLGEWAAREERACAECGQPFTKRLTELTRERGKFCSKACYHRSKVGTVRIEKSGLRQRTYVHVPDDEATRIRFRQ